MYIEYNITFLGVLFLTKPKNENIVEKKDPLLESTSVQKIKLETSEC